MPTAFYFLSLILAWGVCLGLESIADEPQLTQAAAAHWAFTEVSRPAGVDSTEQVSVQIDQLINRRLAEVGLVANQPATDAAIFRRVHLDLKGLPPAFDKFQAYAIDPADDKYERLVDQLLQSPAYGEKMALAWLDLVRYADTHGLHLDNHRDIWMYRDYVIQSFNQNKPWNQFITEQLAGDLLDTAEPAARLDQQIATGLLRLNLTTNEAGSVYEEVAARNMIDRTNAFGTIFLGLTLQCAACHDHKTDPLTQRDYYSLAAFFNNLNASAMDNSESAPWPSIAVPTPSQQLSLVQWERKIDELTTEWSAPNKAIDDAQVAWEQSLLNESSEPSGESKFSDLTVVGPFETETIEYAYEKDYASIGCPYDANQTFRFRDRNYGWTALSSPADVQSIPLPSLENRQSVAVVHQRVMVAKPQTVTFLVASSDGLQCYLGGEKRYDQRQQQPGLAKLAIDFPVGTSDVYFKVISHRGPSSFDVAVRSRRAINESMLTVIRKSRESRSPAEVSRLRQYYRAVWCEHPELVAIGDERRGYVRQRDDLLALLPKSLVYRERTEVRSQPILRGGRYDDTGEPMSPSVPAFLLSAERKVGDRVELANWLTSQQHPLTARVAVNRFWQQFFGVGIVETSEDLGASGAEPCNQELLDYLAGQFFAGGWDVKRLVKAILMSQAYRRDAKSTLESIHLDPTNRMLARGPRVRLDAESIRDQALSLAGLIDLRAGGPSSKPPQPAGLWESVGHSKSNTVNYIPDLGKNALRRSIYTYWKRTSPPPLMLLFDAPSRESCAARRVQTHTPSQALAMLNEPQMQQAAIAIAKLTLNHHDIAEQDPLKQMFCRVLLRDPSPTQYAELLLLLSDLRTMYAADRDAAIDLVGLSPDAVNLAAWTVVAMTLLNLDEALCK